MNADQVKTVIKTLHEEGETNVEIAKRLAKQGYKSNRTKKPLSQYAVGHIVRKIATPSANPAAPQRQGAVKASQEDVGEAVLALAQKVLSGALSTEDRKAVAMLLLS